MFHTDGIQLENNRKNYLYNTSLISYLEFKSSSFENYNFRFENLLDSTSEVFINKMNSNFYQSKEIEIFMTFKQPFYSYSLPPPNS